MLYILLYILVFLYKFLLNVHIFSNCGNFCDLVHIFPLLLIYPPGSHPQALRVATHNQQVPSLVGSYLSAEAQST